MKEGSDKKMSGKKFYNLLKTLARQGGFEPPADFLERNCSIHLSYWRT